MIFLRAENWEKGQTLEQIKRMCLRWKRRWIRKHAEHIQIVREQDFRPRLVSEILFTTGTYRYLPYIEGEGHHKELPRKVYISIFT